MSDLNSRFIQYACNTFVITCRRYTLRKRFYFLRYCKCWGRYVENSFTRSRTNTSHSMME